MIDKEDRKQSGSLEGAEDAVSPDVRNRIVAAASDLIAEGGPEAATTRAVAAAAAVQAPTIYRLFGDKRGLLDAVAERGFAAYIAAKAASEPHPDAIQELRLGWDLYVAFGLAHPGLFVIMSSNPRAGDASSTFAVGEAVLLKRIRNIALSGRLRVSEARAMALLQAMGTGTVLTLLGQPIDHRDPGLSEAAREAVISVIAVESADDTLTRSDAGPSRAAALLRASLHLTSSVSPGEKHLLEEILDRIADEESFETRQW